MTIKSPFLCSALAAMFAGGCLIDFEGLRDRSLSDSQDQPAPALGEPSEVFPIKLVNIGPAGDALDGGARMRFAALGHLPPSLSVFEYDSSGGVSATTRVIGPDAAGGQPDSIAADIEANFPNGLIAMVNSGPRVALYEAPAGDSAPSFLGLLPTGICGNGPHNSDNKRVVVAQTDVQTDIGTGTDDALDVIEAGGSRLLVFPNITGDPATQQPRCYSCFLDGAATNITAIEHPIGDEDSILVVIRTDETPARTRVVVASADQIRVRDNQRCFEETTQIVLEDFIVDHDDYGTEIAVGDFNNDEVEDVAFSVPSENDVFVHLSIAETDPLKIEGPDSTSTFGSSLVFGDVNQADGDELLVGARDESLSSIGSGAVHVYESSQAPNPPGVSSLSVFTESDPSDGQLFGQSLAAGEWQTGVDSDGDPETVDLAIVGAANELFTFFAIEDAIDPRD